MKHLQIQETSLCMCVLQKQLMRQRTPVHITYLFKSITHVLLKCNFLPPYFNIVMSWVTDSDCLERSLSIYY